MADWANPQLSTNYTDFLNYLKERDNDAAVMFDGSGDNLPTNTIRWSSANTRWEKFDGSAWNPLAALYNINVAQVGGKTVNDDGTDNTVLWTAEKIIAQLDTRATTSLSNVSDSTLLTKIKNVDGAGSGLDADLLDGVQGSTYARKDQTNTMTGRWAWSTSYTGGWGGLSGDPAIALNNGNITEINALVFNNLANSGTEGLVFAATDSPSSTADYMALIGAVDRQPYWYENASVSTKYKIWTEHNDGAGSGLDADLLDGRQGTNYRKSIRLPSNGDTETWYKIGRLDGINATTGAEISLLLENTGDYGTLNRATIFAQVTQRGDNTYQAIAYQLSPAAYDATKGVDVAYVPTGTYTCDVYVRLKPYNPCVISFTDSTFNGAILDTPVATTSEPDNIVYATVNKIWHSGNDGQGSGLTPDLATSSRIGGVTVRYDETNNVLYMRTDGGTA